MGRGGPSIVLFLVLQEKPEVWIFVGDLSCFKKNCDIAIQWVNLKKALY